MTLDHLRALCVDAFPASQRRPMLFDELRHLAFDLMAINFIGELWIDGSYATEKPEPDDIDLSVTMFESDLISMPSDSYYFLVEDLGENKYSPLLDTYLTLRYLKGDPRQDADTTDYWSEKWSVGWDDWLKGFVVIKLGESDVGLKLFA
jgi:hypothetical protein